MLFPSGIFYFNYYWNTLTGWERKFIDVLITDSEQYKFSTIQFTLSEKSGGLFKAGCGLMIPQPVNYLFFK